MLPRSSGTSGLGSHHDGSTEGISTSAAQSFALIVDAKLGATGEGGFDIDDDSLAILGIGLEAGSGGGHDQLATDRHTLTAEPYLPGCRFDAPDVQVGERDCEPRPIR